MAEMLPAWVPRRIPLVYVTGVIEIVAAIAVLIPRLRTMTGWALILILALFLPVNIHAAVNHVGMGGHEWGPIYLLIRVPLQAILIGWVWWFVVRSGTAPIRFCCKATLGIPPEEIARQILDLNRWSSFSGYGVLPGIKRAVFEINAPQVIGTRIRVTNTDGSSHVEEIVEWEPDRRLRLHMYDFSTPLSWLASGFDETWEFKRERDKTQVIRSFEMHPHSALARPLLWLLSRLLKRAIVRHLQQMIGAS